MACGGFKLRKWITNDKVLKGLIDAEENHETASESVTSEEEMYTKFTLGMEISKAVQRFWVSRGIERMMKFVLVLRKLLRKPKKFHRLREVCSAFWPPCLTPWG